jgi:hypothetical protein
VEQETQRLAVANEEKLRQTLSPKEFQRHSIERVRDQKIVQENSDYDRDKKRRNTNLETKLSESKKWGGTKKEMDDRSTQINDEYSKKEDESEKKHLETIHDYEESAKSQLKKLDSSSSSTSDSALISEIKTVTQVLLQIKESLGFQ